MTTNNENDEIVVFERAGMSESFCSGCGVELSFGDLLKKEEEKGFCLKCAGLDHLVRLPSGNKALTSRAKKYSSVKAKVRRFKAPYGYSPDGVLVEQEALARAKKECELDEEKRANNREKQSKKRVEKNTNYIIDFALHIQEIYPSCPAADALSIANHTCQTSSGRVGRSAAAKKFEPGAIDFAVRAYVRHNYTNYDELLMLGWDKSDARSHVFSEIQEVMEAWQSPKEELTDNLLS